MHHIHDIEDIHAIFKIQRILLTFSKVDVYELKRRKTYTKNV